MTLSVEGLEIDADRPFQERMWFWERVGWVAMLLLIVAALAGFTGTTGPASSGKVEAEGATINYPRIARWQAADTLSVEFSGSAGSTASILIPDEFAEVFAIEGMTPQPSKVTATPEGQSFEFELAGASRHSLVHFSVRPRRPAFPTDARGTVSGEPYSFTFTVLP